MLFEPGRRLREVLMSPRRVALRPSHPSARKQHVVETRVLGVRLSLDRNRRIEECAGLLEVPPRFGSEARSTAS